MFALGFIGGIVSGILLCMFSTTIIHRTKLVQEVQDILDPKEPDEIGGIVEVNRVERTKRIEEGVSLDESIDEDNG